MFDLHNGWREANKGIYCLWVCWSRERERVREGKRKRRSGVGVGEVGKLVCVHGD